MPLVEVAVGFAAIEGALWSRKPAQFAWALVAFTAVALWTWRSSQSARELGVGKHCLADSLWIVPTAAVVCGIAILTAWFAGSLHGLLGARAPVWHALLYAVWALVQEFLMLSFIFVRFEETAGTNPAIVATGALFALAHIPNLLLIYVSLGMSLAFCWAFKRYRNIYPLAVAHAMLGITLSIILPNAVTHYMRVGISYYVR